MMRSTTRRRLCRAGRATALREAKWRTAVLPAGVQPPWPWHLDSNEFGTRDFRATKYNIFETALRAGDGSGLHVDADGTANVRACLAGGAVQLHLLTSKANPKLSPGDHLTDTFHFQILVRK